MALAAQEDVFRNILNLCACTENHFGEKENAFPGGLERQQKEQPVQKQAVKAENHEITAGEIEEESQALADLAALADMSMAAVRLSRIDGRFHTHGAQFVSRRFLF